MSDPILTETGSHVTATFNPQLGIVVEIMGLGRVSRMILNSQAARDLAETTHHNLRLPRLRVPHHHRLPWRTPCLR